MPEWWELYGLPENFATIPQGILDKRSRLDITSESTNKIFWRERTNSKLSSAIELIVHNFMHLPICRCLCSRVWEAFFRFQKVTQKSALIDCSSHSQTVRVDTVCYWRLVVGALLLLRHHLMPGQKSCSKVEIAEDQRGEKKEKETGTSELNF